MYVFAALAVFAILLLTLASADVCSSWQNAALRVNATAALPFTCVLSHPFLKVQQGVIKGVKYEVSVSNDGSEWLDFVVSGAAGAVLQECGGGFSAGHLEPNVTLALSAMPGNNLELQFDVRLQGADVWFTLFYKFPIRSECSFLTPQKDTTLSSEEVEPEKAVLIQAPPSAGLQINIDAVIPEEKSFLIYNVSEYSEAITLTPHTKHVSFIILEESFILLDYHRCSSCLFQIIITIIATKYECNSTLTIPQGSLKLEKHSSTCGLHLQALPSERIILKLTGASSFESDDCHLYLVAIGPFSGEQNQKHWTPCFNASKAQTETYISDTNLLQVQWNSSYDVLLNYQFVRPCANRTYSDSPVGQLCSPGYPDILFACNQTQFMSVPFPVDATLSVSGMRRGDCLDMEVSAGSQGLLRLCADDDQEDDVFVLSGDSLDFVLAASAENRANSGFCVSYRAAAWCPFGWVVHEGACYKVVEEEMAWADAEEECKKRGGHLASISDNRGQKFIDDLIQNSSIFKRIPAYWIGANDLRFENCYEWTDGQPFYFTNWFPGWEGGYSAQPNDDGLSQQNCVELRNVFRYPGKGEGSTGTAFFWNDRDCRVRNPFVCQTTKPGAEVVSSCNRTVSLNAEEPRAVMTSPLFPAAYPNQVECHYHVEAPPGHRVVALFTDFVLEESDSCEYDALTLTDGDQKWHRCGDWESKLKQLRYVSHRQSLHLTFTSDVSHSYKGFRVELSILAEKSAESSLCDSDMFHLAAGKCYLLVNFPEASWGTARQICAEAKARLVVVEQPEQVAALDHLVRSAYGYMSGVIYWVGAHTVNNTWKWLDGSLLNPKHLHVSRTDGVPSCLAIQWKQLRGANALRWTSKNCNHPGRFICEKSSIVGVDLNKTIVGESRGNLSSPSPYPADLHYRVSIAGPPESRVLIRFHDFELEWQEECLYDYVLLQSDLQEEGRKICGHQVEPLEWVSLGHTAYLTFHSDFSVSGSGFSAWWEVVDVSPCLDRRLLILEQPVPVASLRPYLAPLQCRVTALLPDPTRRMLVTLQHLDIGPRDCMELNLDPEEGKSISLCDLEVSPGMQWMAYGNEVQFWFHSTQENATRTYRGYNFTCEAWDGPLLENTLYLNEKQPGIIYSLNFNHEQPIGLNYSLRLVTRVGHQIQLRHLNASRAPSCGLGAGLEIRGGGRALFKWCPEPGAFRGLTSTLHVLTINAWNFDGSLPPYFLEYSIQKDEHFVDTTQSVNLVESCRPNPCQHGGRCISNGTNHRCHCFGQYTGLFCHLTWCEANVCGENGVCNLTLNGWRCDCVPGFTGARCQDTLTPCLPNPCGENGHCLPQNESYMCRCTLDFEGSQCEKLVMRIPYKPLSERMLEEPFWLGLITVFSVLLVILLVYCIKRKFADKIEKFLADEIERSKYQPSPPAARYSLSSTQASLRGESPQTNPKSLLSRMRKNSVRTPDATTRTFSFDEIMRRVHSSKRRDNPQPPVACSAKKDEEKSRILASLVAPPKESRRMSLDEFFRMSERKLQNKAAAEDEKKETSFTTQPSGNRKPFLEIQSIQEQSFEYVSSSESLNEEPSTSQVQADVSPNPSTPPPTSISIKVDDCESELEPDSQSNTTTNCDNNKPQNHSFKTFTALSPIISRNSSYLEVPKTIPAIQVFSADEGSDKQEAPCRKDFLHGRKYSCDLPKILITTNLGCDSDEASPPRTPNPKMVYLSPLAVIATNSESNLSTSGYSSISSLSRCNSSSPISDEVDPPAKKPPYGVTYVGVHNSSEAKAFFCHCPRGKRQSYSTDDSIDDEGIALPRLPPHKKRSPSPPVKECLSSSESDNSESSVARPKSRRSKGGSKSSQDSSSAPMASSSSESISAPPPPQKLKRERMEHAQSFPPSTSEDIIQIDNRRSASLQVDDEDRRMSPYLRRQEAILEDDPSDDDSSSETTVLLGQMSSASDTKE